MLDFSEAKAQLSDVMSAVVRLHQPRLVQRHHGKESMVLLEASDLARFLGAFRFEPRVTFDEGEVTIALERLGTLGFGSTLDEALDDLARELRSYATRYFAKPAFYAETDRRDHWPWLLRFAITPEDRQVELLREDARAMAAEQERAMKERQASEPSAAA